MPYLVYLRTFKGEMSERTLTKNQDVAAEAFATLVNRTDLDGQEFGVMLTYNNSRLAHHRFDRTPGYCDYWRDKLDQIKWPSSGRPAEMEGGKRVNVYLDAESLSIAEKIGNGNVSEGIRKALKQAN